jgi:hypothetical protein
MVEKGCFAIVVNDEDDVRPKIVSLKPIWYLLKFNV